MRHQGLTGLIPGRYSEVRHQGLTGLVPAR